jgi:hypothetical protein
MRSTIGYSDELKVGVTKVWQYSAPWSYYAFSSWLFKIHIDSDYRIDGLAWVTMRFVTICGLTRRTWTVVPLAEL